MVATYFLIATHISWKYYTLQPLSLFLALYHGCLATGLVTFGWCRDGPKGSSKGSHFLDCDRAKVLQHKNTHF
ncbi:hypothetical protein HOY80DRAFT_945942 [Tuber brumale]|nr:hypothetical protein HOY80DRAFT_945942 [Tuber brumale]